MSKVYSIKTVQQLSIGLEEAWEFFSNPANLAAITPGNMGFNIISKHHGGKMYPGQVIEYKVSPVLNVPLYWMTEITHVEDRKYFVDEQRFGPYALWHHQHHFKTIDGGVRMTDILNYAIPYGPFGRLANQVLVKKQIGKIFDFRTKEINRLFGSYH